MFADNTFIIEIDPRTVDQEKLQVLKDSRDLGFESTNFDLIYGLPKQIVESYRQAVGRVIKMRPERIALYNYAHLPKRPKA